MPHDSTNNLTNFNGGITTVFFDMGNTLAGLNPSWQGIYHQVFQRAGLDLPIGEVEEAVSYSWGIVSTQDATAEYITTLEGNRAWQREIEERVMERLNIHPAVREELFWEIIKAFENPDSYALYHDTVPTLEKLQKSGYKLAIISNWSWHLPELCNAMGLTPFFSQIFTSARVGYPKPNPKIFEYALQTLEIRPDEALHVGDSLSADVGGATELGINALWLVRPEEQPLYDEASLNLKLGKPVRRISTLLETVEFLEDVNSR
ncbi:MAG TPA: HAD-IA family hydrolase [Chloroflexia bacterium]|nr:HAD-IA family hydrolase [Chloroflexia bacterium]